MSVVAYHFWSPTCAPCKFIKPSINDLQDEFEEVQWISVNIQNDTEGIAAKFGVTIVPTIVVEWISADSKAILTEKHTGTNIAGYYRIIRNALRAKQQSSK